MRNSREATVVVARCRKTKEPFGIRIEKKDDGAWHCTWAFKTTDKLLSRESYEENVEVSGQILLDPEYPGCPYCGAAGWCNCSCNKLTCWDGESSVTCAWCGEVSEVGAASDFDLEGSGF